MNLLKQTGYLEPDRPGQESGFYFSLAIPTWSVSDVVM